MTTTDPLTEAARMALRIGVEAQQASLGLALERLDTALADLPADAGVSWQGAASALFTVDLLAARGDVERARQTTAAARASGGYTRAWLDE